jgi:hypothetical protein
LNILVSRIIDPVFLAFIERIRSSEIEKTGFWPVSLFALPEQNGQLFDSRHSYIKKGSAASSTGRLSLERW